MIRNFLLGFASFFLCNIVFAQNPVVFYLDRCQFASPDNQPYIEVSISVDGNTVRYKKTANNKFQASANVTYLLKKLQGKDTLFMTGDKFNLLSLEVNDTTDMTTKGMAFTHLSRINLTEGNYILEAEVKDNYQANSTKTKAIDAFSVSKHNLDEITFSDIEFISSIKKVETENEFTKHGYEIIPFGTNALFIDQDVMRFYTEVYHADKTFTGEYFLQARIKCGNKIFFEHTYTNKKIVKAMDVFTGQFDISKLPSQHYALEITARQTNEVKQMIIKPFDVINSKIKIDMTAFAATGDASAIFNKYTDTELDYYISSLSVISSKSESEISKSLTDRMQKINFLYGFWKKREKAEEPVGMLWDNHVKRVAFVSQEYKSNLRPGYKTDRGRVFLLYGIPSNVERFPAETGALPYEIWRYDRLGAQANVLFIFYDPDLVTNEYPLLHSNKYGEVNNPRWRSVILKQNTMPIDYENQNDGWDTKLNPND